MEAAATTRRAFEAVQILENLNPTELPAPPDVAMQVMHACSDPDSDVAGIASLVSTDPTLTAELLRVVNSAFFGFAGNVASINQAVSILGYRALRHYVLCIAVRDALGRDAVHGASLESFWQASLARAVAARSIGEAAGVDADECFTAGLLLDIGLAALFHSRPDLIGHWDAFLGADPDERLAREREVFGIDHARAGALLAQTWGLPASLGTAIGTHHEIMRVAGAGCETLTVTNVARAADWAAAMYRDGARREDVARTRAIMIAETGLEEADVDTLIARLPEDIAGAAQALGFELRGRPGFEDLLRDANLALAEENLNTQELNWRLQRALDERDALGTRLRSEVETARIIQRSLLPAAAAGASPSPFSGLNAPARELSGDFYDHLQLADGRSSFCLADVSGKGMDAALLMAKASGLFHCLAKLVHDPGKLLGLINAELVEASVRGMFVTMIAGVYDPEKKVVSIVNAGHPPALVLDARGAVSVLPAQSPPLGIVSGQIYEAETQEIAGRSLYLFSDGLIEASDRNGGRLGYSGLVEVLRKLAGTPRSERPARVLTGVGRTHDLGADDVTLLVLEG